MLLRCVSILLLFTVSVSLHAKPVFPDKTWKTATPESQGLDSATLNEAITYLKANLGKHGTDEVMVIRNGYVLWQGPNVSKLHPVWSCTKSVFSTCFGLLWDDGKVNPEMYAKDYWPAMAKDYPAVQFKHFLSFTSGYQWNNKDVFDVKEPMYPPGEKYHYSKQGNAFSYILTKIAGQSMAELFKSRIANEIGITDEEWQWAHFAEKDGFKINGGSGAPTDGLQFSATGMAKFGWLYANNGVWDGKRLISQRYIDAATKPQMKHTMAPGTPKGWYAQTLIGSYGMNWWVNGLKPNGQRMWPNAPLNTFAAQGNRNNICFVIRDWNMAIVRLGQDKNINVSTHYDKMFEIIKSGLTP